MTTANRNMMSDTLRWVLDSLNNPSVAAADWLARDIDPDSATASELLGNPDITLPQIRKAKAVYKTMRIVGEKSADRRVGARLYAAAIAAGLVRHGVLITTQSESALERAFLGLVEDRNMSNALRELGGLAISVMMEKKYKRDISSGE